MQEGDKTLQFSPQSRDAIDFGFIHSAGPAGGKESRVDQYSDVPQRLRIVKIHVSSDSSASLKIDMFLHTNFLIMERS